MIDGARVAVVVPAYNEARLVARTLGGIPAWVDLVGGGGRRERGRHRRRRRGDERRAPPELVRHEENRGAGAAIAAGYRRAFARGADVAAVMAGDGQMDPRDLCAVVAPVAAGEADYVKGDRLSHPEAFARMPLSRWIGNHGLSAMTRIATGLAVRDSQCGYTAISRAAYEAPPFDALWPRYGYPNDLLSHAAIARLRVRDVVVRPVYGDERSGIRAHHLVTAFPVVLARGLARRARAALAPATAATRRGRARPPVRLAEHPPAPPAAAL
ncbi:MAG: glycosyltransferase [Sandaracinaceae bacterium]|nr:glycosyltransferase [Sandaracinaceae bacterium]